MTIERRQLVLQCGTCHQPWEDGHVCAIPTDEELDRHSVRNNTVMPGLRVGRFLSIQQRFEEWLETDDGRTVYREVVRRALGLYRRGWTHYSHKAIIESIRYDRDIHVGPENGFKINDHYSSRIARRAMAQYPELDGFFEVRELRA